LAASVANDAGNGFRADNAALIASAVEPVTTHLLNTVLTLGFGQRHWGDADRQLHGFESSEAEWRSVATKDDLKLSEL
jgi:hypothetical protein